MTLNDIHDRLKSLDIQVAYNVMRENTPAPYVVFYETGGENFGADNIKFLRKRNVKIELYCKDKDIELETEIEKLFIDCDLDVTETWLESSDLIRITYEFETINKIII